MLPIIISVNQLNAFLRNYVKGTGEFKIIANFEIVEKFIRPIIGIVLVIGFGVFGAVTNILIIHCIMAIWYWKKISNKKFIFKFNLKKTYALVKPGFLIFVNKIVGGLFWSIDLLIISMFMDVRDVGIYGIVLGIFVITGVFTRSISARLYRHILLMSGKKDIKSQQKYKVIAEYNSMYLCFVGLILGLGVIVYSVMFDTVLTEYKECKMIIPILTAGYAVYTASMWFRYYLDASNQMIKRLIILAIGLLSNLTVDLSLIPEFGLWGASIGSLIGFCIISFGIMFVSIPEIFTVGISRILTIARYGLVSGAIYLLLNGIINWNLNLNTIIYIDIILEIVIKTLIYTLTIIFITHIIFYKDRILSKTYMFLNPYLWKNDLI